jgi:hypothetical protein
MAASLQPVYELLRCAASEISSISLSCFEDNHHISSDPQKDILPAFPLVLVILTPAYPPAPAAYFFATIDPDPIYLFPDQRPFAHREAITKNVMPMSLPGSGNMDNLLFISKQPIPNLDRLY